MRGSELLDCMELADPGYVEAADERPCNQRKMLRLRWTAAAACLALVLGLSAVFWQKTSVQPITPVKTAVMRAELPGVRKYLNYNGCQYVFLESGAPFALEKSQLTQALGAIEWNIKSDPEQYADADFAATYLVGGTIWQVSVYDPSFRLAVELDGSYYLCENAGYSNGDLLDAEAFFQAANFRKTVSSAEIYDHSGAALLHTLSRADAKSLIKILSQCTAADLSGADYEAIARAQNSGESFQVLLRLNDTTAYRLYLIPSLSIAMMGNGRYILPEAFHASFDNLFSELQVTQ